MTDPIPRAPLGPDCPPSSPMAIHYGHSQTAMEPSLPNYGAAAAYHERHEGRTATHNLSPLAECRQTRAMQERDAYPDDNRHELFLLGEGEKKITYVEDSRTYRITLYLIVLTMGHDFGCQFFQKLTMCEC
jgi:hypothetical protein